MGERDCGTVLLNVPSQRHFERGLAVAKQIVRSAHSRLKVLPEGHVIHLPEVALGNPPGGSGVHLLRWYPPLEVLEPDAVCGRQALEGPLILREEAKIHDV